MPPIPFTNVQFGDGLTVTDLGGRSIRVDGSGGGGGGTPGVGWEDVGVTTGGGGLQFDTYPQAGDWLYVETTDSSAAGGSPDSWGMEFKDMTGNGIALNAVPFLAGDVDESSNGAVFGIRGSGVRVDLTGSQTFSVAMGYNGTRALNIENVSGVGRISLNGLPTTDPGVAGVVWNSNGDLVLSGFVPPGGGLKFNTNPQTGGWLLATMNSYFTASRPGTGTGNYGLIIETTNANALMMLSSAQGISLRGISGVGLAVSPTGFFAGSSDPNMATLTMGYSNVQIVAGYYSGGAETGITLNGSGSGGGRTITLSLAPGGTIFFESVNDAWHSLQADEAGDVTINLRAAKSFTVKNHSGAAIFRVDESGDLHGLTGKALTFNL